MAVTRHIENRADAAARLGRLLASGDGADVDVVVGGTCLPAHRCVLSAASDVWRAMLASAPAGSGDGAAAPPRLVLDGVGPAAARAFLSYAYSGEATLAAADAPAVVAAAERYALPGLRVLAERFLPRALRVATAADVLAAADAGESRALADFAAAFIRRHFDAVADTPAFGRLPAPLLEALLASDDVVTEGEEAVLRAALRWGLTALAARPAAPPPPPPPSAAPESRPPPSFPGGGLLRSLALDAPLALALSLSDTGATGGRGSAAALAALGAPQASDGTAPSPAAPAATLRDALAGVSPLLRLAHLPSESLRSPVLTAVVPPSAIVAALFEKLSAAEARAPPPSPRRDAGGGALPDAPRTRQRRYAVAADAGALSSFRVACGDARVSEGGRCAHGPLGDDVAAAGGGGGGPVVLVVEGSGGAVHPAPPPAGTATSAVPDAAPPRRGQPPQLSVEFVLEDCDELLDADIAARIGGGGDADDDDGSGGAAAPPQPPLPLPSLPAAAAALAAAEVVVALVGAGADALLQPADGAGGAAPVSAAEAAAWLEVHAVWAVTSCGAVLTRRAGATAAGLATVAVGLPFGVSAHVRVCVCADAASAGLAVAATIGNARLNAAAAPGDEAADAPSTSRQPSAASGLTPPHAPPHPFDVFAADDGAPHVRLAQLHDPAGGVDSAVGACVCAGVAAPAAGTDHGGGDGLSGVRLVVVARRAAALSLVLLPSLPESPTQGGEDAGAESEL